MIAPLRVILDRLSARKDRSESAVRSGCGFTQAEIDAAEPVEVLDEETKLASDAVTAAKIAEGAIDAARIRTDTIGEDE